MLLSPAAIVALVLYLIVGQLTVPQRFQTRFKSLGHRVHKKISSALSLSHAAFELRDYPVLFEDTTLGALPIIPVETNVIYPSEATPASTVPLEDYVEAVTQEVRLTRSDDHPFSAPVRVFVVSSEHQGPFGWQDLFNYRVLEVLAAICFSVWLSWVVKLLSRSESHDGTDRPIDTPPELLPPKFLAPPTTIQIQILNRESHAPLEPISPPAPPESSTLWLAPKQEQQDQPSSPSPPLLRLLDFSPLQNEPQKKLSPLLSPADYDNGIVLPDMASGASSFVVDKCLPATPEHMATSPPTADAELTSIHDSNGTVTTSDDSTREGVDTTGFDTEPEDDDDGSTTVTNSIVNLADLDNRLAPVPAEVLAVKLESVTTALIEEAKSLLEPPAEEPTMSMPPSDDSATDLSSCDGPTTGLGTVTQESDVGEISVNVSTPSEPSSDTIDTTLGPVCIDKIAATDTGLETSMEGDETPVEDGLPSRDDSEKDWTPNYEIPTIVISPPSEVDPEDFAQQLDSEEESEDIVDSNLEDEPKPESEQTPVEGDDPWRSPKIKTGKLWSDESVDLGPLLFSGEVTHTEVFDDLESTALETYGAPEISERLEAPDVVKQTEGDPPAEEKISDIVTATLKDIENPVAEVAQQPIEGPQPAPEVTAQEVTGPAPVEPVPPICPSPDLQSPPRASESRRLRIQGSPDNGNRGEGGSRGGGTTGIPRLQYFHCCKLHGRPKENWKIEKACIPKKTNLQEWQFARPTDKDGENPTTRIAIDNLDADWFRTVDGVLSYNYLTEAMGFFSTKSYRCWRGRTIGGVEYSSVGYATADFDSVDDAVRMFDELQGRRLRGHTWHWRLEFVDPNDETHGGRKVVRTGLVPDSVKQALAAKLEASIRKPGRSNDVSAGTAGVTRPPAKVRPQLSIGGRSLFTGAMSNVVQDHHTEKNPARSTARAPHRRPHRS